MRKIRLQKRANVPTGRRVLNSILFVALALVFCGVFLAIVGFNPFEVYAKMWKGHFLRPGTAAEYCGRACP